MAVLALLTKDDTLAQAEMKLNGQAQLDIPTLTANQL